ncbi:MAG: MopE-related protein [Sandaracinaceae bacterium]
MGGSSLRRVLLVVGAVVAVAGCGRGGPVLTVRVVSDLRPVLDFALVRVESVREPDSDLDGFEAAPTVSRGVLASEPFSLGVDVARLALPGQGTYRVHVALQDEDGATVVRGDARVEQTSADQNVVFVLARSCVDVECAEGQTCLGGVCVPLDCPGDPECPVVCDVDGDCSTDVPCADARCVGGTCLEVARDERCPISEVCDPDVGCVPDERAPCEVGGLVRCSLQQGVCAGAVVLCLDGLTPRCGEDEYGVRFQSLETLCDGLDNDCDGLTDEAVPPACPLQQGVCAGSRRACGGALGLSACNYVAQDPRYEPLELTCDGADNDCDGVIDETGDTPACPLGEGVCFGARSRCAPGGGFVCDDAQYGPDYELTETRCDGLDNDCDGAVDNLLPPLCDEQAGVCEGARRRCAGALGFAECTQEDFPAGYEVDEVSCDGLDNDCDGEVDEALVRACTRGCTEGLERCQDGAFVECDAPPRTVLAGLTLSPGRYAWSCVDVEGDVVLGEGSTLQVDGDLSIDDNATLTFAGRGNRIEGADLTVAEDGRISAGDLEIDLTDELLVEVGGMIRATGAGSGGGGGGCYESGRSESSKRTQCPWRSNSSARPVPAIPPPTMRQSKVP